MTRDDISLLLDAYDAQLRAHVHDRLPDSVRVERDGPLRRTLGFAGRGWVEYRDLAGLDGEALDALIARQVQVFAERGEPFEWKLHGHDRPADLPDRLRAAGFVPEDTETVVIGRVDAVAAEPSLPGGVVIREVRERGDFARIAQLEESVWHQDHSSVVFAGLRVPFASADTAFHAPPPAAGLHMGCTSRCLNEQRCDEQRRASLRGLIRSRRRTHGVARSRAGVQRTRAAEVAAEDLRRQRRRPPVDPHRTAAAGERSTVFRV